LAKEFGGTGWSPAKQHIYLEELQATPAPSPLPFGVNMVGPVIYTFGSEEQKKYYLPRIANLDDWWCQGFSEPGSGSDLASLKTTAKRKGDVYVINGQKTWTTLGQHADWIFCLCRTNPEAKKQEGISFILIDMKSRGITVRPIQTIDGGFEVNEVFFDDVEVPVANLVGQENKGWDYAKFLLGNERTNIARVGMSKERIRRVRELASKVEANGKPLIEDDRFREKLAATEIELKALELSVMRVIANETKNGKGKPDPASSILKIKGSDIQQTISELLVEVAGPFAAPYIPEEGIGNEEAGWSRIRLRTTSTTARSRSTAGPTRSSAALSPRQCWDFEPSSFRGARQREPDLSGLAIWIPGLRDARIRNDRPGHQANASSTGIVKWILICPRSSAS
jgi:alkylation response protein AidB-like acyl-CoA dehydrogenase